MFDQEAGHFRILTTFTPKGSMCKSIVQELIECLTADDIKSLSGLDDVKVEKGRDNFIRLRTLAKKLIPDVVQRRKRIKQIDDLEQYYQSDFATHLERNGSHSCNCLTCGFCDPGTLLP